MPGKRIVIVGGGFGGVYAARAATVKGRRAHGRPCHRQILVNFPDVARQLASLAARRGA
jgi:NADPH-dependent 2,4-dienoyl-CoA reductase/sulfur reductase-like enzyme